MIRMFEPVWSMPHDSDTKDEGDFRRGDQEWLFHSERFSSMTKMLRVQIIPMSVLTLRIKISVVGPINIAF